MQTDAPRIWNKKNFKVKITMYYKYKCKGKNKQVKYYDVDFEGIDLHKERYKSNLITR